MFETNYSPQSIGPDLTGFVHPSIRMMFGNISKLISNLLENLSFTYKSNQIVFDVHQYHTALMRLLAPIEILNQQTVDSQQLNEKIYNKKGIFSQRERETQRDSFNLETFDYAEHEPKKRKQMDLNLKEDYGNNGKHFLSDFEVKPGFRKHNRVSHLGHKAERLICEWAKEKVRMGLKIFKKDIIFQATKLGDRQGLNLQGSSGWYRRFLNRHEDVKNLMESFRYGKHDQDEDENEERERSDSFWKIDDEDDQFPVKKEKIENEEESNDKVVRISMRKSLNDNRGFGLNDSQSFKQKGNEENFSRVLMSHSGGQVSENYENSDENREENEYNSQYNDYDYQSEI